MSGICIANTRKFEAQILPKLPTNSMNIWQKISQGQLEYRELAHIVESDPILAGEVIRITNSTFYGLQGKIGSVLRAVILLGNQTIRSLVRGLILRKAKFNTAHLTLREQQDIWSHNLATAILARSLAAQSNMCDPEEAFLTGLLHDIGKLIKPAEAEVQENLFGKLVPVENHVELATLLCTHWYMPENIAQAILWHHQLMSPLDAKIKGLHTILRVANTLAKIADYSADIACPVDHSAIEVFYKNKGKIEHLRQALVHLPEAFKSLAAPFDLQVHESLHQDENHKYIVGMEITHKGIASIIDLLIARLGYTPASYFGPRNDNLKIHLLIHDHGVSDSTPEASRSPVISLSILHNIEAISLDELTAEHVTKLGNIIEQMMMKAVSHV